MMVIESKENSRTQGASEYFSEHRVISKKGMLYKGGGFGRSIDSRGAVGDGEELKVCHSLPALFRPYI